MSEVEELVWKIVKGEEITSKEDLQLYKNHTDEVERCLIEAWETYERRVNVI